MIGGFVLSFLVGSAVGALIATSIVSSTLTIQSVAVSAWVYSDSTDPTGMGTDFTFTVMQNSSSVLNGQAFTRTEDWAGFQSSGNFGDAGFWCRTAGGTVLTNFAFFQTNNPINFGRAPPFQPNTPLTVQCFENTQTFQTNLVKVSGDPGTFGGANFIQPQQVLI